MPDRENLEVIRAASDLGRKLQRSGDWILQHFKLMGQGAFVLAQDLREVGERLYQWAEDAESPLQTRRRGTREVEVLSETLQRLQQRAQSLRRTLAQGNFTDGAELVVDALDTIHTALQATNQWSPQTTQEQAPQVRSWFSCRKAMRSEAWYRSAL